MPIDPGNLYGESRDVLRNFAATLISAIVIISLTANSFLLKKFVKLTRRWEVSEVFYVNVCIWDLVVALFPTPLLVVVHSQNAWNLGEVLCQMNGFMLSTACIVPWLFFLFITANRHCYFMHRSIYKSNYSKKRVIGITISTWILGIIACASPSLGWGVFSFNPHKALCFLNFNESIGYGTFLYVLLFFFPLTAMLYTNLLLLRELPKQIALELYVVDSDPYGLSNYKVQFQDLRQHRSFCYTIMVHAFCWLPYISVSLLDALGFNILYSNGVPFHVMFLIVALAASPLRALVFILTNPLMKKAIQTNVDATTSSQMSSV